MNSSLGDDSSRVRSTVIQSSRERLADMAACSFHTVFALHHVPVAVRIAQDAAH